ncbi:MAG TPA: hypothetical protein VF692_14590 [Pyrinomonadaceae bacterium]|jgi:hypothetical protein
MLFNRNPKRRNRVQRTIVIIQTRKPKLSRKIVDLSVPCPKGLRGAHLPVLLNFAGTSVNNSGNASGMFRCPLCGRREVWAEHSQTKKPVRIG